MFPRICLLGAGLLLSSCGGSDQPAVAASASTGCAAIAGPSAAPAVASTTSAAKVTPAQRFLVKLKPASGARAASAARFALAKRGHALRPDLFVVESGAPLTASALASSFPADAVEYVEPDTIVHADLAFDDPGAAKQWAHETVHSAEAWDVSTGSDSVVVAVLDSGVDYNHPDLKDNMWRNPGEIAGNGIDDDGNGFVDDVYGWNFADNNNRPLDENDHGTHVSGTVGAVGDNGIGITGHSPHVRLMALKFLGANGSGFTSDAIRGIDYAIEHGAKVINNSWGSGEKSQALSEAIDRARAAGILFVAAAGNTGLSNDRFGHFPSNYPQDNVVRVAASDEHDALASWSNYGARSVELASPGVHIYSTRPNERYQYLSGTSMATPLVSGVLATMLAARPDLSYAQIKGALLASVDPVDGLRGKLVTGGRINAGRALAFVRGLPGDWAPPPRAIATCK